MDIHSLRSGGEHNDLPETYIIFLTEKDVIGANLPIYHIERCILETNKLFGDESHIIYVNGENKSDTELGKLMQDFTSADYKDMHYKMLANEVEFLKNNERGASEMCDIMEQAIREAVKDVHRKHIIRLLHDKRYTHEDIAEVLNCPIEDVEEIVNRKKFFNRYNEAAEQSNLSVVELSQ